MTRGTSAPHLALAVVFAILTGSLLAQPRQKQEPRVSVPFVGCKSDGQAGPVDPPDGTSVSVNISSKAAQKLAYYSVSAARGTGVLGPRGWYCFGTYGSGGDALYISPEPISRRVIFATDWKGFAGSAIELSNRFGDTSGRFDVAEIIARVFPAYKAFATSVMELFDLQFQSGPYPNDVLTYKSKTVVEYKTPDLSDGLGTHSWLRKNDNPINGVAILKGETPNLLLLSIRLPAELNGLTSVIIGQVERDERNR